MKNYFQIHMGDTEDQDTWSPAPIEPHFSNDLTPEQDCFGFQLARFKDPRHAVDEQLNFVGPLSFERRAFIESLEERTERGTPEIDLEITELMLPVLDVIIEETTPY